MTKFIASIVLATSVLAGVSAAHADQMYGNALRAAAQSGQITPGGVFDGR
jgi:hypothetical protein